MLGAHRFQHLEARHVGQAQVEDHAIAALLAHDIKGFFAGAGVDDFDVVMTEQFVNAHLLGRVVLDDQQTPAAGLRKVLDLRQGVGNAFARGGLGDERKRAARKTVLTILVEGNDLHRDMARERILLELAEHVPAQHVRQEHVERHCRRLILLSKLERSVAAHRQQHLEPPVASQVDQDAGVMRVVLDDEQNGIAGLNLQPIVGNLRSIARSTGAAGAGPELAGAGRGAVVEPTYFIGR